MAVPATGRNRRVALLASGVAVAMLGLAFASVPLYRMFCQVTGFGGTTQRAEAAPQVASASSVSVRFDANTSNHLAWSFHPAQTTMNVKFGEQAMAHYRARNTSNETITASAIFNVTPPNAGVYFNKIQCFCFTEQRLAAGESATLPVLFFVDPALADDPILDYIDTITLSYTFYPANPAPGPVAGAGTAGAG